ncbi:unnamed protein product [Gongylonema pulchrum]|uniref:Rhotekin-2 n=1 Tax=Gongylonema pulchrum TaxID=637853 RepID=A0A183EGL9_9BILA|nr:unnamed protein product [Gongylonema pulchrum]
MWFSSLESPTRNLNLEAGQDIEITSAAGEIQLSSLLDISINSKQAIHFIQELISSLSLVGSKSPYPVSDISPY